MLSNSEESPIFAKLKTLNYRDLLIFLIPFFIFLYYLHVFDPGLVGYDSFNQLHQIATGEFTNWHPFFHTFIEMLCLKVYSNTVSIAVLQIITFSVMWMIICKYERNDNQKNNKAFILQIAVTLIISLIPINAIFSITFVKDILFSYFLMFLCFLIKVLIDKEGNISLPFVIVISIVMAFVAQLRLNGLYVIIPLLLILAVYLYRKNEEYRWYVIIPVLTIAFILLIASLNLAFDVKDNQNDALRDVVSHMLADYDLNLELEPDDKAKLNELMSEDDIRDNYQITYKDAIRNKAVNKTVWKDHKFTYIGMAASYSLKNPAHFIQYLLGAAPITWDITKEDLWTKSHGEVYFTDVDTKKASFYKAHSDETPVTNYDNATAVNAGTDEYKNLNSFVNNVKDNLLLDTLFDSPALYMYLAIIILASLHILMKSKEIWLVYLPNFLNILIIFVSIPAQQNRYLYSNLLVCYLLIIILIGVLTKNSGDKQID